MNGPKGEQLPSVEGAPTRALEVLASRPDFKVLPKRKRENVINQFSAILKIATPVEEVIRQIKSGEIYLGPNYSPRQVIRDSSAGLTSYHSELAESLALGEATAEWVADRIIAENLEI